MPKDQSQKQSETSPKPVQLVEDALAKYGISEKSLNRIKLGGATGKQAALGLTAFAGLTAIAVALAPHLPWASLVLGFLIIVVFFKAINSINHVVDSNPALAALDGAEILVYREQEAMLAVKGIPGTIIANDANTSAVLTLQQSVGMQQIQNQEPVKGATRGE